MIMGISRRSNISIIIEVVVTVNRRGSISGKRSNRSKNNVGIVEIIGS